MNALGNRSRLAHAIGERWYLRGFVGALLLALLLTLAIVWVQEGGSATDQRVALTFLVNLIAVVGLQTFMGNSGVISFGHVAFIGIGAYGSALLTTPPQTKELSAMIPDAPGFLLHAELGFLPATLIVVAFVAVFAGLVGIAFVRMSGAAAAIGTLSLLIVVRVVLGNLGEITRGPKTFFGVPQYTTVWWALGWAVVVIFIARLFRESGIGLRLRASRSDELASAAVGVDVKRARWYAWVLSAAMAAVSGALYAHLILAFAPQQFYFELTFTLIVMAIVGGSSVSAAVLGAAAISVVQEILRRGESGFTLGPFQVDEAFGLTTLVMGLLVLATVIVRPGGLLGRWELDELLPRAWRAVTRRRRETVAEATEPKTQGKGEGAL